MSGWLLPFVTLTAGSELFPEINHNPTSSADVVALVSYLKRSLKLDSSQAVLATDGVILWRLPYPTYRRSRTDNGWKQAEWSAQKFSRPGYQIRVEYDRFRAGLSVAGDHV